MRKRSVARVHRAIEEILSHHDISLAKARSARVSFLGTGLYRTGYLVTLADTVAPLPDRFVVLIPHDDISDETREAWEREIRILQFLEHERFPMRFPRLLGVVRQDDSPILITEHVTGYPLNGELVPVDPREHLDAVARVASVVHALPRDPFLQIAPGAVTCREFALSNVAKYRAHSDPTIASALTWCDQHLPPEETTVVLHGDLLGQNIFKSIEDPTSIAVIDWTEARTGDPAYEFAIVTRGVGRPFKRRNGLATLLARYAEQSTRTIDPARVRFYEVTLVIEWLAHYLENNPQSGLVASERTRLKVLMQ